MGAEKVLFKSKEKKSAKEVASVLRAIAGKVEQGTIRLSQGQQQVSLEIPQSLTLEIKVEEEAKRKLKKSLEIELEWVEGENGGETMIA